MKGLAVYKVRAKFKKLCAEVYCEFEKGLCLLDAVVHFKGFRIFARRFDALDVLQEVFREELFVADRGALSGVGVCMVRL